MVHTPIVIPGHFMKVLEAFKNIFEMPSGLPPICSKNQAIILKESTSPVSVRPYRYLQAQKNEIECLVQEMLDVGIIQPSTSPLSSTMLLVKKKMGVGVFVLTIEHLIRRRFLTRSQFLL